VRLNVTAGEGGKGLLKTFDKRIKSKGKKPISKVC
jgi:hypothetical protein